MKGLQQKMSKDASLPKRSAEHKGEVGGFTSIWITETNTVALPEEDGMLGQILNPYNLNRAYLKVCRNKGSCGIDGLRTESLKDYLKENGPKLITAIKNGKYRPNPVRRVEIPKDVKSKRPLGIPTVVDRVIQQAVHQVLSPIYEGQFSNNSYGFRPNRSTHKALFQCRDFISQGYKVGIDMDMANFFGTVNHSKLVEILSRTIKDGRVISLIHKYLNAGVVVENRFEPTQAGVPQGSPLSPLLGNIMLNELDHELEKRGHKFVRYADDIVILCKSKRAGERIMDSITQFIEDKLFLKVNRDKTAVVNLTKISFLGYSFYRNKGEIRFRITPKSIVKLKDKLRGLTCRSNGWGNEKRKSKLIAFIKGWVNYYKYADILNYMKHIDEWYRRRLRMIIWKQWKQIKTRRRNLIKLGIDNSTALRYANTRKSYWRIAGSPILFTSVTNKRLKQAGYVSLLDYYLQVRV
jgi:group II intron reverse transcriptase/maturase